MTVLLDNILVMDRRSDPIVDVGKGAVSIGGKSEKNTFGGIRVSLARKPS